VKVTISTGRISVNENTKNVIVLMSTLVTTTIYESGDVKIVNATETISHSQGAVEVEVSDEWHE
jgi:hypothetical protein